MPLLQFLTVCAEGRGVNHLTARICVAPLDVLNGLRMGEHPLLGADIAFKAALLQLRSGGAVQNQGKTDLHTISSIF